MSRPAKPTFKLTLQPAGDTWRSRKDANGMARLRAALKCLLRSFGLRAVSVEPAEPEPTTPADHEYAHPFPKDEAK